MNRTYLLPLLAGLLLLTVDAPASAADTPSFFRTPRRPAVPNVENKSWLVNPLDAFLLARLEAERLSPSPRADKARLLRRVTFDLTGLPPTLAEQEAFLSDSSPDAYRKVVERLLASPRYGERWAQHWLDLVRYAESDGFKADDLRPSAHRYRDYVLLKDLKRRGLLDSTLVVWGGEFGRTPMSESGNGRDHNPFGFTVWLAGGGVQGGLRYGATDDIGLYAVENRVHVHDLHATILHCLGLDHRKLTLPLNGRDERPTINGGHVV